MIIRIALLSLFLFLACQEKPKKTNAKEKQTASLLDTLDLDLKAFESTNVLPGFAVSIFKKDTILYQKGFGMASLSKRTPFQVDHIQIIASVSKTLVGVALMKLVEERKASLDEDINETLPYKVTNPGFPNEKITLRMLASHTSSISGTKNSDKGYRFESPLVESEFPDAYKPLLDNYNKTEDLEMSDFLERKLSAQGMWYENEIFTDKKPGSSYEYSNIGIALLARIIEIKTNMSFATYTEELILKPFKMQSSYWNIEEVPSDKHVTYYNELKNEVPQYSIVTYPDGGLYSSVSDMTRFLQEMIKGYDGERTILSKESFQEMMRKQFDGEELTDGVCWDLSFDGLIGHSGNDFGTATLLYFSPESGIGRILFTNISIETEEQEEAFYGIFNTLFEYDFDVN